MRSPNLIQIPKPPPDKKGWPWTEESPQLPDTMPDGSRWPKISIVTPSLNQSQYIEETIRSVLLQGYPNFEHIIIDGGSNDGSVDKIKKYEQWLTYWVSEPDRGQSHAINKGFERSKGNIFVWLNSDDIYFPGILEIVAKRFKNNPDRIVAGDVINFDPKSRTQFLVRQHNIDLDNFIMFWNQFVTSSDHYFSWHQPGLFLPAKLIKEVGSLDESLVYSMDYDLLCRLLIRSKIEYLSKVVARFRYHKNSKTSSERQYFTIEKVKVYQRYRTLLNNINKADSNMAYFLIKKASYLFRHLEFRTSFQLLASSWRATPHHTVMAFLIECKRLLLAGRYTGRI